MPLYEMYLDGFYGTVSVPKELFNKIDRSYQITHSTETKIYMCANNDEYNHIESLGIGTILCDWFCITLKEE